jgi:glycosyltransferase involved in cell wall biosynthesis
MLRDRIEVIFDGVDTEVMKPNPAAEVTLPNGRVIRAGDEVLTFINRNLEPYRGYHTFMRALPKVMAERPEAQVVIIGGDEVSYGRPAPDGKSWKELFLSEVRDSLDMERVHFMGKVPYATFVSLMQVSRVHAYLTYPFVLSWSMLEAMAAGCFVIGSRTAPVQELIEDGVNGRLVDFFDVPGWSDMIIKGLARPKRFVPLREAARKTIVDNYDLRTICLPRMVRFVEGFGPGTGKA